MRTRKVQFNADAFQDAACAVNNIADAAKRNECAMVLLNAMAHKAPIKTDGTNGFIQPLLPIFKRVLEL